MNSNLQINLLGKSYFDGDGKELEIFKNLTATFNRNQSTAIIGASGVGKSSLLHLLGGLDTPTEGEVLFEGEKIFQYSPKKLAEWRNKQVGFVFQFHHLLPDFTALENVMMPAVISGTSESKAKKQALKLLEEMSLSHRIDHKPGQLSGGEQQRVSISRALINQPALILADEPTGNLDEQSSLKVLKMLQNSCNDLGATLIMVTHNQILANALDSKMLMTNGKLILKD